jgi:hypothetical protein
MVASLRSPRAELASGAPQAAQKLAPSGASVPHRSHVCAIAFEDTAGTGDRSACEGLPLTAVFFGAIATFDPWQDSAIYW